MPKYNLWWTEVQHNQYCTNEPIEADTPEEAWEKYWNNVGSPGYDADIMDSDTTDSYDHEAFEVDE